MAESSQGVFSIDGGILEGGGQILRMTAALGALLKRPIRVHNIRANRPKPGLRAQHLSGFMLVGSICGGKMQGAEIGSTEVTLSPNKIVAGKYESTVGTAGSVGLLLQVSLPCLFFSDKRSELTLGGGTDAQMAPPMDFVTMVLKPTLEKFGLHFEVNVEKRGFFPKGGGVIHASVDPVSLIKPIEMTDRGRLVGITGVAFAAGVLPPKISDLMADNAVAYIKKHYGDVLIDINRVKLKPGEATASGNGIILVAETTTGCLLASAAIGSRNVPAEEVGEVAAKELVSTLSCGTCVDPHLQDQLIIFMALAEGKSRIKCGELTLHTKTAIYVVEAMTQAKFTVKRCEDELYIIECDGIGLKNSVFSQ